jgi:hypothetical protein
VLAQEDTVRAPLILKLAWSTALFSLGLVVTRDWHRAVLDHYSVHCTMLPDPAPFPQYLLQLADGKLTAKGVRELFACEPEPLPGWEKMPQPKIVLGSVPPDPR